MVELQNILDEMFYQLQFNFLNKWYPKVIDSEYGGYFTNLSYNMSLMENQEKMVVTQARHLWTLSKAAEFLDDSALKNYAEHGYNFLKNKMWDSKRGGFYQIKNREGKYTNAEGWRNEKRIYGNAFGLFAISSLYHLTKNNFVLDFAQTVYNWINKYAYDEIYKGYFQFLTEECYLFNKESEYKSLATDSAEVGFKDQNSSIHLLEAFSEYYNVNKDDKVKVKLEEMLFLIRDVITTDKGYLQLFFDEKWNPISFNNSSKEIIETNFNLDHVSFGHNYETAFLMLEASYSLGIENDIETLKVSKKMVDHALENGWDNENNGFFDEGFYFNNSEICEIIKNTKTWWAQAEALNIFLIMSQIFPEEKKYLEIFIKEWNYVKKYLIDHENGDWYWGGLDKELFQKTEPKGNIWKGTYHNGRALMNCITLLSDENFVLYKKSKGFRNKKNEMDNFINHWKTTAKRL